MKTFRFYDEELNIVTAEICCIKDYIPAEVLLERIMLGCTSGGVMSPVTEIHSRYFCKNCGKEINIIN